MEHSNIFHWPWCKLLLYTELFLQKSVEKLLLFIDFITSCRLCRLHFLPACPCFVKPSERHSTTQQELTSNSHPHLKQVQRSVQLPWNNGKEDPRWGVAEIQKMSPSTTGRCSRHAAAVLSNKGVGTADQWECDTATQQPIIRTYYICCPGVVDLLPIIPW